MGYAQRAKRQRLATGEKPAGNPTLEPLMVRIRGVDEKKRPYLRVLFSDRTYVFDEHGTARRVRPVPVAGELRYGPGQPVGQPHDSRS